VGSLRDAVRHRRRALMSHEAVWRDQLHTEVAFWDRWLTSRGEASPWDYERRLDPAFALQEPTILEFLDRTAPPRGRILDVGAGPLTWLGRTHPTTALEVVAVDPLAAEYDDLLARHGIEPPVRTRAVRGEELLDHFPPASFDVAFARNALDHAADPLAIVRAMTAVTRLGGIVVLRHLEREAERERYEELHQWNLEARNGALHLWSRRERHLVAGFRAHREEREGVPWVVAALERSP
jgi:SAM-dependent methyltransferase